LPAGRSIAAALARRDPGRLPYDCGAPLMFALALAADRRDPASAYFGLWRHLQQQREAQPHTDGYRWQDLLPTSIEAPLRVQLVRAIEQPDAYSDAMRGLLRDLGVTIEPRAPLDADDRHNLIGVLVAHLMREDYAGRVSFWNAADGLLLDKPLPQCKTLHPGGKLVSVLGEPPAKAALFALATRVTARCGTGQPVQIDYAGQLPTSYLICSKALPALSQPVRMTVLRKTP